MAPTERLLQALAVAVELTGTELSKPAVRVMAHDLARYPERQVLVALERCRRELRGRLTIADVLARLDDGRPSPEEAWAMLPRDESTSTFWTEEMREAYSVAYPLIREGEAIQARMAFLERYRTLLQLARDAAKPVSWDFTPGTDAMGRQTAVLEAAEKGRISAHAARLLLPEAQDPIVDARLQALAEQSVKRLTG